PNFEELRSLRRARDQEIVAWADALTPKWLAEPYTWHSVVLARTFSMPGFAVVSQFFNHQTHHRGQITTLLVQLGIDPGVTDIPLLPVLEA
ncbi:MAG TPA: DinB family protein, partial [Polyangiaceae bacterium]|nr:DinB family protein [Polyangiaceae bacterium]